MQEFKDRPELEFDVDGAPIAAHETYEGAYEVTPKIYEAVELPTRDRLLRDDVTVKQIPQYEVSNEAGGTTLIMGEEYYHG